MQLRSAKNVAPTVPTCISDYQALSDEEAEALRWRQLVWSLIPPLSRKMLLSFLTVRETIRLDTAVAPGKEKERDHLEKAYRDLRSPAFDANVYSDRHAFRGLHWARKRGIDLRTLKLKYKGESGPDQVLGRLVTDGKEDLATYFMARSEAKDCAVLDGTSSTLVEALCRGYLTVVRCLVDGGANVNGSNLSGDTPLQWASRYGRMEMVRALLAAPGMDVNKSSYNGDTPLNTATYNGHVEVFSCSACCSWDRCQQER